MLAHKGNDGRIMGLSLAQHLQRRKHMFTLGPGNTAHVSKLLERLEYLLVSCMQIGICTSLVLNERQWGIPLVDFSMCPDQSDFVFLGSGAHFLPFSQAIVLLAVVKSCFFRARSHRRHLQCCGFLQCLCLHRPVFHILDQCLGRRRCRQEQFKFV